MATSSNQIGKRLLAEYDTCMAEGIDDSDFDTSWDYFKCRLESLIRSKFPNGVCKLEARNVGWNKINGSTYIKSEDIFKLIGEGHVRVYRYGTKGLYLNVTNHDNPVNGDEYYITSVALSTYYNHTR